MKKERMKVLNMVEDGKISVEEATRLLEALSFGEEGFDSKDTYNYTESMEDKILAFSKSVDNFAKEFGGKIGSTYKGMEPKLKNATKAVVMKTASIADDISKSLNETLKNMDEGNEGCTCTEEDCACSEDGNNGCCCEQDASCCEQGTCCDDTPKEN